MAGKARKLMGDEHGEKVVSAANFLRVAEKLDERKGGEKSNFKGK